MFSCYTCGMRLGQQAMRRGPVLREPWAHPFIVEHNLLLHREAMRVCTKVVADWLTGRPATPTVRVLDLACSGGMPVVMNGVMRQFVIHRFNYVGVGGSTDHIRSIKNFSFSPNVHVTLTTGNCWQPAKFIQHPPDIVFIGLNTHHAVPEELQYLAKQLRKMMPGGGLFLNYDLFRPAQYPYLRRPDHSEDGTRSLALIPPEILRKAGFAPVPSSHHWGPNWRQHFLKTNITAMEQEQCPKSMIDETIAHVTERDYPVSPVEMCSILKGSGFKAQTIPLSSDSPLAPFFNVVAATL